ncbi:MAG: VOC family protein [Solirubrobacteraceae bacterium]|nr:VOC family protein [Solirubrobacteraceae bacterium]
METIDPRVHIDHVVLRVSDVSRSVGFYGELLGFEALREDHDGATLAAPGGDHPLIVLRPSVIAGPAPQEATGLFHTALRWPTLGGLGEVFARLLRERYPLSGASDHGVSEALYLDDPDGNGVELYHDRPRETWPPGGPGERVGMVTRPLDLNSILDAADGSDTDGVDVGHVHLQVADLPIALGFWVTTMGFDLMQHFGSEAAFVSAGGYHHHVGMNTWRSKGGPAAAPELPGLDTVAIGYPDRESLGDAMRRLDGAERQPAGVRVLPVLA